MSSLNVTNFMQKGQAEAMVTAPQSALSPLTEGVRSVTHAYKKTHQMHGEASCMYSPLETIQGSP